MESSVVEDTLVAAEVVRQARDIAITFAIGLLIIPILYIMNGVLVFRGGPVLLTGYNVEITLAFIVSLILIVRSVIAAGRLTERLHDQAFLTCAGIKGSAHAYFFRCLLGLDNRRARRVDSLEEGS